MVERDVFVELCGVVDVLMGEGGCAWDRAQTHASLRQHLLEESYEVADAIDLEDYGALREELGDLMLQVIMHSRIAAKSGRFGLADVMGDVAQKLVRRHTHIFGDDVANSSEEVVGIWEANKLAEKDISSPLENMSAVPKALPALARAQKVLKRSGQEFSKESLISEIRTLIDKLDAGEDKMENHGSIFLFMAALSAKNQINAEFSLTNAIQAFINTFDAI